MSLTHAEIYDRFRSCYPPKRLLFRPASDSWDFEGKGITQSELVRIISFQLEVPNHRVLNMLTMAANDSRNAAQAQIQGWLKDVETRPQSDKALRAWLRAIERSDTTPICHEANVQAMKQWLRQVKRGILERSVVWHVAPIFWSQENGTGKSYNIRRLIEPIGAFTRNVDVNELGEKFSGRLFAQTLIAFLDEFAGVENADTAQLKAILTGKPIDRRSMHSESGFYSTNRMSCIASSNMAPPHGFIDHTGARRFWSIHCSGDRMERGSSRMAEFDNMDIDAIWAAVSGFAEPPQYTAPHNVLKYMDDVRKERLRTKTSLETFCEECLEHVEGERTTLKDFQNTYRQYCGMSRQTVVRGGYKAIGEVLRALGYEVVTPNNRYYLKDYKFVDFEQLVD